MSDAALSPGDVQALTRLAAVLMPETELMPAADAVLDFSTALVSAFKASGYTSAQMSEAIALLPVRIDWDSAKAFAAAHAASFEMLSTLAASAYFTSPTVMTKLGYPVERRHPPDMEEFVREFETGVLDSVMARAPFYRDPTGKN